MLRRYGPWAMAALVGSAAVGQEPIPAGSLATPNLSAGSAPTLDPAAMAHDPHAPGWLRRRALSDPLGANAELREMRVEDNPLNLAACDAPGLRYGHGRTPLLGGGGAGADFQAANTWAWTNVEKKLFINYTHATPYSTASKLAYGPSDGAEIGVEVLPWVLRDDDRRFTRMGWTTAFDYRDYKGNRGAEILSTLSGNTLASAGGRGFSAIVAGTWRTDFRLFGMRMSPSLSAGLDFDTVSMRQTAVDPTVAASIASSTIRPPNELPIVQPTVLGGPNFPWLTPQSTLPLAAGASPLYVVKEFRYTDFAVGGYFKFMLDFPIKQHLNLGIGLDVRLVPGQALLNTGDYRKQIGLLFQLGGDF